MIDKTIKQCYIDFAMENNEAIKLIMEKGGNVVSYNDAERIVHRIEKGVFESIGSLSKLMTMKDKIVPVYVEKSKDGVVWLASHVAYLCGKNQEQAARQAERYLEEQGDMLLNVPYPLVRAACNFGVDMPYIYSVSNPCYHFVLTIDMR